MTLERCAIAVLALPFCLLAACASDAGKETAKGNAQAIVYGQDNRIDLYQADDRFAQLARDTVVALISPELLHQRQDGSYSVDAPVYGEAQSLCPGERFSEQPAAASCSGVLVAPDVVATAGHCLTVYPDGRPDCTQNRYVFGFGLASGTAPITLAADDVFNCSDVLGRIATPSDSPCHFDVVLLRLDRPVKAASSYAAFRSKPVEEGEGVVVIGFTAGLPVKIDEGARVIDARRDQGDYFTLSSDTFAVSSGSAVFDADGDLVGLFSRGRRDYDQDDAGCQRVNRDDDVGAAGYEQATHIAAVRRLFEAVTSSKPEEPINDGQACNSSDYAQVGTRAGDGGTDEPRATVARTPRACAVAGAGIRCDRDMASVSVLALVAVVTRSRRRQHRKTGSLIRI
jgi:hypothetical protein